jgi:chromosome segregation ATPase
MDIKELEAQREKLQASLDAWLQKLEEAKREIALHQGQLILLDEWIKRLNTEATP